MITVKTISDADFNRAMESFAKTKELLSQYASREEAVDFLVKETGLPREECQRACDFLMERDSKNRAN